jgi:2,4-diketo-3-deoxy-L-fuconate hydrolase
MKLATVRRGDRRFPACLENDVVREFDAPDLRTVLSLTPRERVARLTDRRYPVHEVAFEAPLVPPRNVFCVGRNYREHVAEGARAVGREPRMPEVPAFFTKVPQAIVGPEATIHLDSRVSSEYDYEAELAVVIGARCKDVAQDRAPDVVAGYTCANDVTARDLQRAHGQWFKGKSLDESCPLGPWIVTAGELPDPQNLRITFRLDGEIRQESTTARMIFPVARIIAELSRGMTLLPGDVILTGTPDGVGFARTPPSFLRDGQVMEVEIEGIGLLRNRVEIRP